MTQEPSIGPTAIDLEKVVTPAAKSEVRSQSVTKLHRRDKRTSRKERCLLFCRHYRVLVWKNFVLRRRKPVLLVVELLAPLVIPIIFTILHTQTPDKKYDNCFSQSISMPSMGLLSYLQSMVCNFLFACQSFDPPPLNFPINETALRQVMGAMMNMYGDPWIQSFTQGAPANLTPSFESVETVIKNYRTIEGSLQYIIPSSDEEVNAETTEDDYTVVDFQGFQLKSSTLNRLEKLSTKLCGLPPDQNDIGRLVKYIRMAAVKKLLARRRREAEEQTSNSSNSLEIDYQFCGTLVSLLTMNYVDSYTGRLTAFLFGSVYYYPSNNVTDEIMKRASAPWRLLSALRSTAFQYLNHTSPGLRTILNGSLWRLQGLQSLLPQIQTTMNSLINVLDHADYWIGLIYKVLSCANLDHHVYSVPDKEVFEYLMEIYQSQSFPAGIGVNFEKIPQYVMNHSSVPSGGDMVYEVQIRMIGDTRQYKATDLYWVPSPRQSPAAGDMKYFESGFIDIQELISDAIISHTISKPDKLDRAATREGLYEEITPGQEMKFFPTPCFTQRGFLNSFYKMIPQFLIFSWIFVTMVTTKYIVDEKEQRLKEFMKIMGLSNLTHWLGWATVSITLMVPSLICVTLIMKYGIIPMCDGSMLFFFLLSYNIALLALIFLCSTFFSNANIGSVVAGMVFFVLYLPAPMIFSNESEVSESTMFGASLSCQTALSLGIFYFIRLEIQGFGAKWSDFWESEYTSETFSIGKAFVMLWVDTAIYLLFTWYIEAASPDECGVRRKCYYPLTKAYWGGRGKSGRGKKLFEDDWTMDYSSPFFERQPDNAEIGVAVRDLTKRYKRNAKPVLDKLSLNFYANQITSFLGHNGAGKSTLMSILTGMQNPSSGTAYVCGYDIRSELMHVRDHLGFCPQYNILFDRLTVAEHIYFYASLKGVPKEKITDETEKLVQALGFPEKRNDRSKSLSGGQKRKLSVAIAFVANASVVFLDEPTAGVDPTSRRSIWDLITSLKANRTIILTTHHMDEADVLGDQIAILSQGHLKCFGSSLFLKSRHGLGYHLVLQKRTPGDSDTGYELDDSVESISFDPEKVMTYIHSFLPAAKLVDMSTSELILQVPSESAFNGEFSRFFRQMEEDNEKSSIGAVSDSLKELGITSYGLSDTSLEEIFLELAEDPSNEKVDNALSEDNGEVEGEKNGNHKHSHKLKRNKSDDYFTRRCSELKALRQSGRLSPFTDNGQLPVPATRHSLIRRKHIYRKKSPDQPSDLKTQRRTHKTRRRFVQGSFGQQWKAMFSKRLHYFKRYTLGWVAQYILPVILVILAMLFVIALKKSQYNPPMPMHPWWMANTPNPPILSAFYENNMYSYEDPKMITETNRSVYGVATKYEEAIKSVYGWTGIRCVPREYYRFIPSKLSSCSSWTSLPGWSPEAELTTDERSLARHSTLQRCSCGSGALRCPDNVVVPQPPPHVELQTTDIMYNLTSYNITDYLLETRDSFILRRFGGLSFRVSSKADLRGDLEEFLSPNNTLFSLLGYLTPVVNLSSSSSRVKADPVWSSFANIIRLMLPPPYHLRVWFNNKGYTAATGYLNILQNMQFRMLAANESTEDRSFVNQKGYGIVIVDYPLPYDPEEDVSDGQNLLYDVTVAVFTILALAFIPACFITFLVTEEQSGSKHLQIISGLNSYVYWFSVYVWDMISYCIPCALCILVYVAFRKTAYIGADAVGPFIILFILYGTAVLPFLYPFSFFLKTPSTAMVVITIVNLGIGSITVMATSFLDSMIINDGNAGLRSTNEGLKKFFLIFPQYCFGRGLYDMALRSYALTFRTNGVIVLEDYDNAFNWSVTGEKFCALGIETVVYFVLVLLIEHRFYKGPIRTSIQKHHPQWQPKSMQRVERRMAKLALEGNSIDEDVQQEQKRVYRLEKAGSLRSETSVSTLRLTKFFHRKKIPSVNSLSFAIQRAECFGLLGVNGAGKTTTFRILTGSLNPTLGSAYVNGFDVVDQSKEAHQNLGYCPQFDAILDLLTGRETLTLYARLRGIPEHEIPGTTTKLLNELSLAPHADKLSKAYSGGNRRKLSTAVALLGDPEVIFLDEPTSGMDPGAKRFLWDQITGVVRSGKSVVLTSHSMEECEALCHRLGIMVNGQFRCMGSVQQLKNRFGNGYTVDVCLRNVETDGPNVRLFIENRFAGVIVRNTETKCHEYQFPPEIRLSEVFDTFNELRSSSAIEHYSVKQTTLDQVFINFTRSQTEQIEESENDEEKNESGNSMVKDDLDSVFDGEICGKF
ncbi:unnamed protein product [Calicophoron daubneyi]|uniref:Uncharacterized protein n=1 Tax=Calicophoron daubneyi TaxID=300641 RepID=A0AAV2T0Z3_CALDB